MAEDGGEVADLVAGGGGNGEPRGVMAVAGLEACFWRFGCTPKGPSLSAGVFSTWRVVSFAAADCIPCRHRDRCTSAKSNRRQLSLHSREMTDALRQARAQQQTKDWNKDLEHVYSAVALNLLRLHAWWNGHALDRTRTTHLARLELRLAA